MNSVDLKTPKLIIRKQKNSQAELNLVVFLLG